MERKTVEFYETQLLKRLQSIPSHGNRVTKWVLMREFHKKLHKRDNRTEKKKKV